MRKTVVMIMFAVAPILIFFIESPIVNSILFIFLMMGNTACLLCLAIATIRKSKRKKLLINELDKYEKEINQSYGCSQNNVELLMTIIFDTKKRLFNEKKILTILCKLILLEHP